jgi:ABC-2 type transport system ATP-binding protein
MAIEVLELSKSLGKRQVLRELSFSVPQGSITGFLGPNGAGKTTTIRLLLGLLRKDSGTIRILGKQALSGDIKRKIGYLAQDPVFPEELTGLEVLTLVAENYLLHSNPGPAFLEQFGLEEAASRKVASYSRGMKQKLGLAAALLPKPQILLLDEPLSALDPAGRHQVLELLAELSGKTTIFLSSHILSDVERICQRVIVINKGRKIVEEDLQSLLTRLRQDRYRLGIARGRQLAERILLQDQAVLSLNTEGQRLLVTIKPGQVNRFRTQTLLLLLEAGVEITDFAPQGDLEQIFFKILEEGEADV